MNTLKKYLKMLLAIVSILLALSFVFMPLNITLYYGFVPYRIGEKINSQPNPFGISIALIWAIHLTIGFLAGIGFNRKRYLLAGSMSLLCAFLITGISFLYFGWRESIELVEMLVPLTLGILPAVWLYDYLNHKYPVRSKQEREI